jgi:hypothetical protein
VRLSRRELSMFRDNMLCPILYRRSLVIMCCGSSPCSSQTSTMYLYNLTLQRPTAVLQAIVGNFSGSRQQEIIVSHGTSLELLRIDAQSGKLSSVVVTDVFASIRSLASFRLTGNNKGEILFLLGPSSPTPNLLLLQTMPLSDLTQVAL